MSTITEDPIHGTSEAGIAANHPALASLPVLLAPTMEDRFNTLRPPLTPLACWAIGDARFRFSCSFIVPEIAEDLKSLAALVRSLEHKHGAKPLATVFGHTDAVGTEALNKQLSGRRAAAIYALLTRRTDIWEDIFSQKGQFTSPLAADIWGPEVIAIMLTDLGYPPTSAGGAGSSADPVKAFQCDQGLVDDGIAGPKTREKLFREYMDKHGCHHDGEQFQLDAADFLCGGADPAGKGDYQGCSEYNPLLVFSKEEHTDLSKPAKKADRDAANAPNRRVVMYFFHKLARMKPADWPCPRAKDGIAACRKRLWSDASRRAQPSEQRREFQRDHDTFSCRFYERLAHRSPCEQAMRTVLFRIRLFDPAGQALPGAPFLVITGARRIRSVADANADAIVYDLRVPSSCRVYWSRPTKDEEKPTQPEDFAFATEVYVDVETQGGEDDLSEAASLKRLNNLGYNRSHRLAENVIDFQIDIGKPTDELTGQLDDVKQELKDRHSALSPPERRKRLGTV